MEQGWHWGLEVHLNGRQQQGRRHYTPRGRVRLDVGHTYPYPSMYPSEAIEKKMQF